MSTQQNVAEARRAVNALAAAVDRLSRSHRATVDVRRLVEDVRRIRADLELLDDPATAPAGAPAYGDRGPEYDPREFVDGSFEDASPRRQ